MTYEEREAKKLSEITNEEWRPVNIADFRALYLISESRKIYSIKRHSVMTPLKYKKADKQYISFSLNNSRKFFQLDELMLKTFPEKFLDNSDDWKVIEIAGEKTAYEVSRSGTVRRTNNHHVLKPVANSEGYLLIRIRHNGRTITEFLHRLVAVAFVPNPNRYDVVNHIDENRQNDSANNLEWCDKSYNYKYSYKRRKVV